MQSGCRTVPVHDVRQDGSIEEGYKLYVVGVLLRQHTEIVPSPEEANQRAQQEAQLAVLKQPLRQQNRSNWLFLCASGACLLVTILFAFLAVLFDGWKKFTGAAIAFLLLGATFSGMAGLVRWLWLLPVVLVLVVVVVALGWFFRGHRLYKR